MSGLWGGLVGSTYRTKPPSVDPSVITVALLGDSFARWNSTIGVSPYYNRTQGYGWMSYLNMMTANRYEFPLAKNFGVGGYTTQNVMSNIASYSFSTVELVMLNVGTNNIGINYDSSDTIINGKTDIRNYLRAQGLKMLDFTITPRADGWGGHDVTQSNIRMNAVNTWTKGGDLNVVPVDMYAVIGAGTNTPTAGMLADDLHPSQIGAFAMAKKLYDILLPIYGVSEYAANLNNVLDNTDFSGTGGVLGSYATGTVADNRVVETSGNTTAATRVLSKVSGDKQQITFAFTSGMSSYESVRLYQQETGVVAGGLNAYYEIEFEVVAGSGNWTELSVELLTNGGVVAIGNASEAPPNVGDPGKPVPFSAMINFQLDTGRKFVLRTPVVAVGGATYVRGRFSIGCDCTSSNASGSVILHREQLVIY